MKILVVAGNYLEFINKYGSNNRSYKYLPMNRSLSNFRDGNIKYIGTFYKRPDLKEIKKACKLQNITESKEAEKVYEQSIIDRRNSVLRIESKEVKDITKSTDTLAIYKKEYTKNFCILMRAYTTGNKALHRKCVKHERRINAKQVSLLRKLNLYVNDPCPISHNRYCTECTGYYMRKENIRHGKMMIEDPDTLEKGEWYYDCRFHPRNFPHVKGHVRKIILHPFFKGVQENKNKPCIVPKKGYN